ncbi:MAG: CPBP family glutamic-type intramembrane protease [Candidatus Margulisiibacteriota bacterium]
MVWGLWHIPSYYLIYINAGLGDPILLTTIAVITVAVGAFPYTYLFFLSGNILPCVLMHAIYDKTATALITISAPGSAALSPNSPGLLSIPWPFALSLIAAAGAVLAVFLARHFK